MIVTAGSGAGSNVLERIATPVTQPSAVMANATTALSRDVTLCMATEVEGGRGREKEWM
jgi:hypothetical protein